MTLIVGVRCEYGVVLAADQQATHGVFGAPTIGQPVEKIRLLGTNVLLGISGHVGVGQQIEDAISQASRSVHQKNCGAFIKSLQTEIKKVVDPRYESAQIADGHIMNVMTSVTPVSRATRTLSRVAVLVTV